MNVQTPDKIKVTDKVIVLDIREDGELQETGKVKSAVHIPLGQLTSRMSELDSTKDIYVYCRSGGRAVSACDMLSANGYRAYNTGGLIDWYNAGYELV